MSQRNGLMSDVKKLFCKHRYVRKEGYNHYYIQCKKCHKTKKIQLCQK